MNTFATPAPVPPGWGPLFDCVLQVATQLSLINDLGAGARSVGDLALATGTHGPSLGRLLRALACARIVDEIEPGVFALARQDAAVPARPPVPGPGPAPVTAAAMMPLLGPTFGVDSLLYSVRTGMPAFRAVAGMPVFDYIAANPAASAALAAFTADATERAAPALVASADFARFGIVIDVGGGTGTLIKHILRASRASSGVVFDTAASCPAAVGVLTAIPELNDRWEVRGGNFFNCVPPAGDAYVLKSVLHDWDDTAAAQILRNCRTVMTPAARLIIFEPILPRVTAWAPAHFPAIFSDLVCLLMTDGGRERTEAEFRDLLADAGLLAEVVSPVPGSPHFYRVEASAAGSPAAGRPAERADGEVR